MAILYQLASNGLGFITYIENTLDLPYSTLRLKCNSFSVISTMSRAPSTVIVQMAVKCQVGQCVIVLTTDLQKIWIFQYLSHIKQKLTM